MFWFRNLNLLALCWCFCVVVFGAYVRLSDAGLGCPDWPGCYGHLTVPAPGHETRAAAERFPSRPVEAPKAWKEMIHRYLAEGLGFLIVLMALIARFTGGDVMPRRLPWVLVGLVLFQGLLGMLTVTWQLKPLVVTGHLLGGMTTLALLLWMWLGVHRVPAAVVEDRPLRESRSERQQWFAMQREAPESQGPAAPRALQFFAGLALVLLAAQIFLGGWTSTNYAALACPDLPTCHGQWLPDIDAKGAYTLWRGLGVNYEHGVLDNRARVTIHLFHRIGAVVVATVLLLLGLYLRSREGWRAYGNALLAALALQLALGIGIVLLQLPLLLAAGHNAGAALLLMTLVALNHRAHIP
ncbi:MAG TPA: COX15/CtaA family protein [Solimonas sp.]|nr:COX15/CtaA family protein [Solimonas sp.]